MASGSRPSSDQRSSAPGKRRKIMVESVKEFNLPMIDGSCPPSTGLLNCVVCGDQACSHYYYGVACCHGCKCFFWRSVKNHAEYKCRFNQKCEVNMNARNACRYCRFQRCLKAGMQVESVRIETTKKHGIENDHCFEEPTTKKLCISPIVEKIKQLENKIQEEADFNENDSSMTPETLNEIFAFPESMDAFRTKILYRVRLHAVTEEELNFCKFRTLTYATDYIRAISDLNLIQIDFKNQITLLRHSFGPLTIFNMAVGSVKTSRDRSLLCLPTGITISKHESIVTNSFINNLVANNIMDTLFETIDELNPTEAEIMLIRAIVVFNSDIEGLNNEFKNSLSNIRDQLHNALYQNCQNDNTNAPSKFAKFLHLLSKTTLLTRDLIEHIKVSHSFNTGRRNVDPIFYELFGDLFHEEVIQTLSKANDFHVKSSYSPWSVAMESS